MCVILTTYRFILIRTPKNICTTNSTKTSCHNLVYDMGPHSLEFWKLQITTDTLKISLLPSSCLPDQLLKLQSDYLIDGPVTSSGSLVEKVSSPQSPDPVNTRVNVVDRENRYFPWPWRCVSLPGIVQLNILPRCVVCCWLGMSLSSDTSTEVKQ